MVNTCCVFGCKNRASPNSDVAFHRFPKESNSCGKEMKELQRKRRMAWFSKVKRENVTKAQLNTLRICSDHFISGKLCYEICLR